MESVIQLRGGPPDNFIESAEAGLVGMPVDSDPEMRALLSKYLAPVVNGEVQGMNGGEKHGGTATNGDSHDEPPSGQQD
jgi:hypothetical protein